MVEVASEVFEWILKRWHTQTIYGKVAIGLGVVAFVVVFLLFVEYIPGFAQLQAWFAQADHRAQTTILVIIFLACVGLIIATLERSRKAEKLKEELRIAKETAKEFETEAKGLQERWDKLLLAETKEQLWQRMCYAVGPNLVPFANRKTRFLTVLNLKGGVGKTTLTSNIAATLSLEFGLRILLVDVDFQGTLSDAAVDAQYVSIFRQQKNTVEKLLAAAVNADGLMPLLAPMNGVPNSSVVIASDSLESADYRLQAEFFVDQAKEPRFFFTRHFHTTSVLEKFDLVIFDCPPRLTTSTVNAITCSDHVIIPTKLDLGSVNAVSRTITWLQSLNGITQAKLIGVIAVQASVRAGNLTIQDRNNYAYLKDAVAATAPGLQLVFKSVIPSSSVAANTKTGNPAVVIERKAIEYYRAPAKELKERLQL